MKEPADRAVLLLQRANELLVESRAIAKQLEVLQDGESSAGAADRIAYGILVAALGGGLVRTLRDAVNVLKRFSAPAGMLGENWPSEQEKKLRGSGSAPRRPVEAPMTARLPSRSSAIRTHSASSGTGMNSCRCPHHCTTDARTATR